MESERRLHEGGTGNILATSDASDSRFQKQSPRGESSFLEAATQLQQILLQKYLAYARNSGYQAYFQWRRTGVPTFSTGPGTGNGGVIPLRWQYPTNEITTNNDNLQAALQSQYGGNDDINAKMWLIK